MTLRKRLIFVHQGVTNVNFLAHTFNLSPNVFSIRHLKLFKVHWMGVNHQSIRKDMQ